MNITSLITIIGYPMLHDTSMGILKNNGFNPSFSEKKLKSEGSVNLGSRELGVELSFAKRAKYEECYAQAKAEGEAIFTAVFLYPDYIKEFHDSTMPAEMPIHNCKNRTEAIVLFGNPDRVREREGTFKWETWILKPELAIRAEYREDQTIHMWTIGPPIKL
jgi:hypothetical protein